MGYKTIVVFDNDHLDLMKTDPEQIAQELYTAILKATRGEQAVKVRGKHYTATVATVVHTCHADENPILKFFDFSAGKL